MFSILVKGELAKIIYAEGKPIITELHICCKVSFTFSLN
jgi:hypothetical protein